MPIYEYRCIGCQVIFERLELSIQDISTSQCPHCMEIGTKIISRPALICEVFDERATHRLPDWKQRQRAAQIHDAKTRRWLKRVLPPMPHDRGQEIKVYETEFGHQEREKLELKAQLDNMS